MAMNKIKKMNKIQDRFSREMIKLISDTLTPYLTFPKPILSPHLYCTDTCGIRGSTDTVEDEKGLNSIVLRSVTLDSIVPARICAIDKYALIAGRRIVRIIGTFRTQGAKECSQQY